MLIQALPQPIHTDKNLLLKLGTTLSLSLLAQQHGSNTSDRCTAKAARPYLMHIANLVTTAA